MPSGGVETPIPASVFARLTAATRYVITAPVPKAGSGRSSRWSRRRRRK